MKYTFDWKEYAKLARTAVAEGCVLLRNEKQALPIRAGETVSVFGRIQFHYYKSGTGSGGMVNAPYVTGILDALSERKEIKLNQELVQLYQDWIKENPFDAGAGWAQEPWCQKEMELTREQIEDAAEKSDLAVIIIGRSAGEDKDNSAAEGSYLLTQAEEKLIKGVCEAFSRVAVVLNVGNIIDMKWVDRYQPQAVLYAWQGGMEGGHGVADVLTGAVNPCGKLSDTIAEDIADYPSTKNFGDLKQNLYAEDIYVGYRYFETFAKDKVKYPFGFGLSYTQFDWKLISCSTQDELTDVAVRVTNIGEAPGKEVVQVYVCPPQGSLGKPIRNLVGFAKTAILQPGESETLEIKIESSRFASYDDSGVTGHKSCFVLEAGSYEFYAGTDVRSAIAVGGMELQELRVVSECSEAASPTKSYQRLRPVLQQNGTYQPIEEPVPTRTYDLEQRIAQNAPKEAEKTGNKGYLLKDVYEQKISLDTFLAQLSDEELIYLTRGEGMSSPKVTPGTAAAFGGVTEELKGYGIPIGCVSDGPSGIRMDCGTKAFSLPNGTALACTYNTALVEALYEMEGKELRKNQVDALLGPGINLHRNPLNGRNFEYFSEDPFLTGSMAVAELKGMHRYGVTGTIKHFACNNQETSRHDADSVVSERALRELYLRAYEMAVKEAGAYCIMTTYGPMNGIWTAGQYDLLTRILHGEWGYQGLTMTDWWAKINDEGEPGYYENTKVMVRAQNDIYMVVSDSKKNSAKDNTAEALQNGYLTRAQLIRNAKNICTVLLRMPTMLRIMEKEADEWEELNRPKTDDSALVTCPQMTINGTTKLELTGIKTERGTKVQYKLLIPEHGQYHVFFKLKSNAGGLAQIPLSVFVNNQLIGTITINGTGGAYIERSLSFNVFAAVENFFHIYFGESGAEIGEIRIEKDE